MSFTSDLSHVEVSTTVPISTEVDDASLSKKSPQSSLYAPIWYEAKVVDVLFPGVNREQLTIVSSESSTTRSQLDHSPKQESLAPSEGAEDRTIPSVPLSQATGLLIQLPDGTEPFGVPLRCVRLTPPSSVVELFVPRPSALAEVRFGGSRPCWRLGRVKRVIEKESCVEVVLVENTSVCDSSKQAAEEVSIVVSRQSLRRADFGMERVSLAEMGGIVKEVVDWPIEGREALLGVGATTDSKLESIKIKTKLFKIHLEAPPATVDGDTPTSLQVTIIGQPSCVSQAKSLLNTLRKTLKLPSQFQEKRERRLKILAERRETYQEARMVEFPVDEGLIGLIIGKQGEKLSRAARDLEVELRVLPDDQGTRRVRVYGPSYDKINTAREELQLVYQEVFVDEATKVLLGTEKSLQLRDIAQRAKLYSLWLDTQRNVLILWGTKRFLKNFRFLLEDLIDPSRKESLVPHGVNPIRMLQPLRVTPSLLSFAPLTTGELTRFPIQSFENDNVTSYNNTADRCNARRSTPSHYPHEEASSNETLSHYYSLKSGSILNYNHLSAKHPQLGVNANTLDVNGASMQSRGMSFTPSALQKVQHLNLNNNCQNGNRGLCVPYGRTVHQTNFSFPLEEQHYGNSRVGFPRKVPHDLSNPVHGRRRKGGN